MGRGRLKREALHAEASADKRLLQVTDSPQDAPAPTDTPRPLRLHGATTSHCQARSVHPGPRHASAPRQQLFPLGGAPPGEAPREQCFSIAVLELEGIPAAGRSSSVAVPGEGVAPSQEPCQRRVLAPANFYARVYAPLWLWRRARLCPRDAVAGMDAAAAAAAAVAAAGGVAAAPWRGGSARVRCCHNCCTCMPKPSAHTGYPLPSAAASHSQDTAASASANRAAA